MTVNWIWNLEFEILEDGMSQGEDNIVENIYTYVCIVCIVDHTM